jgi:hypothetical protein
LFVKDDDNWFKEVRSIFEKIKVVIPR